MRFGAMKLYHLVMMGKIMAKCLIVPTITTDNPSVYEQRINQFAKFARRIHIDVTDGVFATSRTLNLNQLYWVTAYKSPAIDLHLMLESPITWLDMIVSLKPDKVIVHAESDNAGGALPRMFAHLRKFGIKCGLALLPATQPDDVADLVKIADSILIFGGHLGYQGGEADLSQLSKIESIRSLNSQALIEWDGGANKSNVIQLAESGIQQINVGSAISGAENPRDAFNELMELVGGTPNVQKQLADK